MAKEKEKREKPFGRDWSADGGSRRGKNIKRQRLYSGKAGMEIGERENVRGRRVDIEGRLLKKKLYFLHRSFLVIESTQICFRFAFCINISLCADFFKSQVKFYVPVLNAFI